jgi:hypothetical protein
MNDSGAIKSRFLRDEKPVRLCGIAANLARVRSFSKNEGNRQAVHGLIEETKWFIEWTAADFASSDVDKAAQLAELQVQLSRWQIGWDHRWNDPAQRAEIASQAKQWSDRVLEMSGLLD